MGRITGIILIIILGFAIYANSIHGKFVWDDVFLVRDNTFIKDWSYVSNIFTTDWGRGIGLKSDFYRPLSTFTYLINYSLGKLDVRGYHLLNIILHISVALALYWFTSLLYGDRLLSLLASLFFVAHPIHTETVCYISNRADLLAGLFILLSLILYIRHLVSGDKILYISMLLSYIYALLSKENSLVLPVLILLYHYTFKKKIKWKSFLLLLCISGIYVILRLILLKSTQLSLPSFTEVFKRIPGLFVAIINYARLLLLPFNLHMEYGDKLFRFSEPRVILGLGLSILLLIYAFRRRNSQGYVFFSVLWFFITLLPVSNLYPVAFYMAEHYLYLPSIGFFLILAKGLSFLYRRKEFRNLTILSITGMLAFYSYLTVRQNEYWQDPISFYKRTLKYAPYSSRVYINLGKEYNDIGKIEEAITLYKEALEIDPNSALAYNNLGVAYSDLGKKDEAITVLKKAIEIDPNLALAYINLGNAYSALGKKEEAITLFKKAIEIEPEKVVTAFKKAVEINPNSIAAYNNLGLVYSALGKKEEAIALYKKAIEINPNIAKVYHNLSLAYYSQGQYKSAIEYCDKASELGFIDSQLLEALHGYRERE